MRRSIVNTWIGIVNISIGIVNAPIGIVNTWIGECERPISRPSQAGRAPSIWRLPSVIRSGSRKGEATWWTTEHPQMAASKDPGLRRSASK